MFGGMVGSRTQDSHRLLVGDLLLTMKLNDLRHEGNVGFDMDGMVLTVMHHLLDSIAEVAVLKVGDVEVNRTARAFLGHEEVNLLPTHSRDTSNDGTEGIFFALLVHQGIEFHKLLGGHLGHYGASVSHGAECCNF